MPLPPRDALVPSNLPPDRRTNSDRRHALNEALILLGVAVVLAAIAGAIAGGIGFVLAIVVPVAAPLALAWWLHVGRTQRNHREEMLWQKVLHDISLIRERAPLPNGIDFLRPWAVLPDQAIGLLREIEQHAPATIVDLGSGTSTVLMAALCQQVGVGKVYSVDHDARFADSTEREVAWMGLEEFATVIHAPLAPLPSPRPRGVPDEHGTAWYDTAVLAEKLPESIDLLFVDGPPGGTGDAARYPALPVLASRIPVGGRVILDDARRLDEQEGAINWVLLNWGFELDWQPTYAGTARLVRKEIPAGSPGSTVTG